MLVGDSGTGTDDIFSDFEQAASDEGKDSGMPPEGKEGEGQAPLQQEGKTEEGQKTVPIQSYMAEKEKRQELEQYKKDTEAKLARLDALEERAAAIEAKMPDPNKPDAQLTPEEAKYRQMWNDLVQQTSAEVEGKFKPELQRRDEQIKALETDIILRDFKETYHLTDERLDEVLDYAEKHGLKGKGALEASYDALIGMKYRENRKRTSPSNAEQRELAGKSAGETTSVGDKPWLRPYDPEKDKDKPLSQIISEAKEDYTKKLESTK